jgi:hypothetical protein
MQCNCERQQQSLTFARPVATFEEARKLAVEAMKKTNRYLSLVEACLLLLVTSRAQKREELLLLPR